ncbi:MAG: ion transporter [Eubacterium sp.]|nr:ion transporter [Eubacterium sp.]
MDKFAVKKRIYEIIEVSAEGDVASKAYDIMVNVCIVVGMIPLMIKGGTSWTKLIDLITVIIFIADYALRIYTSDYKMGVFSYKAYLANAVSPMAIIDLLSILPVLTFVFPGSATIRLLKLFRIARIFKLIRYSRTMISISNVIRRVKKQLLAVLVLTLVYIFVCGLMMFQLEPDSFRNYGEAFYWATISITTVGYGDFAPASPVGRIIAAVSSLVGVAVIALPTGIITAAYTHEITKKKGAHEL